MMRIRVFLFLGCLAAPVTAQETVFDPAMDTGPEIITTELEDISTTAQEEVSTAPAAVLRGLDKVDGSLTDIELANGENRDFGRLNITLGECRYPKGNPAGNAYAYLTIRENHKDEPIFKGWMIAVAPALNALDHARYDVWVLRCKIE